MALGDEFGGRLVIIIDDRLVAEPVDRLVDAPVSVPAAVMTLTISRSLP
jgi:hypothetical protein